MSDYALLLEDVPVAQKVHSRAALKGPEALAHLARIRTAQDAITAELVRRHVAIEGAGQVLVNAIFVHTTRETARELRAIPGVAHVVPLPVLRPALDRAATLVNAVPAWAAVGGAANAGAGIKIGVVDSGIDQNHPGFQDAAVRPPAGFPKGDTGYTNNKVIVARSYVPLTAAGYDDFDPVATSRPDDYSPRDHIGHGTAIAMIAAGVQNTGPQGTIQGIASKAFLGNYKVFGSPGLNDFARYVAFHQAMLDAVSDGMDVLILSLNEGNAAFYGPLDVDNEACGGACDIYSQAVESAVAAGVIVVTAAGNDGNVSGKGQTLTTIHTPGTSPSAITVGATVNSHALYQAVRTVGSGVPASLQAIHAFFGDGPHIASDLAAPLVAAGGDGLACGALPGGSLSGSIALIQRGSCVPSDKINNAQNAGAIGVVIYQASGVDSVEPFYGMNDTGIPAVLIGNTDGTALKSYLAANSGARVTLDPAFSPVDVSPNAVWTNSSRGPSPGTFGLNATTVVKPELVAPGVALYTATQKFDPSGDAYDATGYTAVTGTSYAVPLVAGAAAILKQKNPSLSPAQIKSLIVNTTQDVTDAGGTARVNSAGAGKLSIGDGVNAAATLVPATMHFGQLTSTTVSISRQLTVTNISSATATFNIAVQQRDPDSNSAVSVTPASLTLSPGQSNSVTVSLRGNLPAAGSYEGFLVVTGAGPTLRLPYQYLVSSGRPADMFPIGNGNFIGGTNDTGWELDLRVIDGAGVPLTNIPLVFNLPGGVSFTKDSSNRNLVDGATTNLGNAAALINLGATAGSQTITATAAGLSTQFLAYVLPYPTISANGVVSAAPVGSATGVAAGSYISIFGSNLADALQATSTLSLPVSLSTVSVSFDGGGISTPGHLHFVSPGQINVQIPWEYEGQSSVQMKVTFAYLPSQVYTVPLTTYSPAVFRVGGGPAVLDSAFRLVNAANPAKRGDTIQVYVNGLGPVNNRPPSGDPTPSTQPLATTRVDPTVTIGGVSARVVFSGLAPGIVGLYQVNAVVDGATPTGSQPLVVSIGGVNSNSSNLQVQ